MTEIEVTKTLRAPTARIWELISSFHGVERWLPAIKTSTVEGTGPGARRTCTLQDGAELHERLEAVDPASRRLTYAITASPLPITGYTSSMTVRAVDETRCELVWRGSFEVAPALQDEMVALLRGIYESGADGLERLSG